jgi:hypothetical protein
MKRLFKKFARTFWLVSAPVHRPVIRKFDHHIMRLLCSSSQSPTSPGHLDLALSSVVRELARLQIQVEVLQEQIDDLESCVREGARRESRLSVVGETG